VSVRPNCVIVITVTNIESQRAMQGECPRRNVVYPSSVMHHDGTTDDGVYMSPSGPMCWLRNRIEDLVYTVD